MKQQKEKNIDVFSIDRSKYLNQLDVKKKSLHNLPKEVEYFLNIYKSSLKELDCTERARQKGSGHQYLQDVLFSYKSKSLYSSFYCSLFAYWCLHLSPSFAFLPL